MTKAIIRDNRILCGKCGALLEKVTWISIPSGDDEDFKKAKEIINKYQQREIKCKHKGKGQYCNEINLIDV